MTDIFRGRKTGLVLAGGGAKGAYQAGCLKALAEITDIQPSVVAGTSIGTLNGAVVAAEKEFSLAANKLLDLWERLGREKILKPTVGRSISIAPSAISMFGGQLTPILRSLQMIPESSIFNAEPIEVLLREAVHAPDLRKGHHLWATLFPSAQIPGAFDGLSRLGADILSRLTGTKVEYHLVNEIENDSELYEVLLASAAIPIVFPRRDRGGSKYVDGGLQDNVPIQALRGAGCEFVVVIHLSEKTFVNRWKHADDGMIVIELSPTKSMASTGIPVLGDFIEMFNFHPKEIQRRIDRGYEDTASILEGLGQKLDVIEAQRDASLRLRDSTRGLSEEPPL